MKKSWIPIIGGGVLIVGLAAGGASSANPDEIKVRHGTIRIEDQIEADYPYLEKLTSDQAVRKVLDTIQGRVLKVKLENADGFLVYDIEMVSTDNALMDIKVDAGSGELLSVHEESAGEENCASGEHGSHRNGMAQQAQGSPDDGFSRVGEARVERSHGHVGPGDAPLRFYSVRLMP